MDGSNCPELETLAALADGSLEPDKREKALAHVDQCDVCYETLTETALLLQRSETVGSQSPDANRGFASDRRVPKWLLRAAALLLIALLPWAVWTSRQSYSELARLRAEQREWQDRERALRDQLAEARGRLSPGTLSESVFYQVLAPTPQLRGRDEPSAPLLQIADKTQWLRFELEFDPGLVFPAYRVSLRDRDTGGLLLTTEGLSAGETSRGRNVVVGMLASMLGAGSYRLTLEGVAADGAIAQLADYDFRIERLDSGG